MRRLHFNNKVLLRLVCVLGLLLAAFAHQPASIASEEIDLSAYTLPDGSLPSFCLNSTSEDGSSAEIPCEFCRISGDLLPPAAPVSIWLRCKRQTTSAKPVPSPKTVKQVLLPGTPLRGPPKAQDPPLIYLNFG